MPNIQISVLSKLCYVVLDRGVYFGKKLPVYQNIKRLGPEYTLRRLSCT